MDLHASKTHHLHANVTTICQIYLPHANKLHRSEFGKNVHLLITNACVHLFCVGVPRYFTAYKIGKHEDLY